MNQQERNRRISEGLRLAWKRRKDKAMKQEWKRDAASDWTYSEGCGCKVTFFAASNYHTSRMLPGETCTMHVLPGQEPGRDHFIKRARMSLHEYLVGF